MPPTNEDIIDEIYESIRTLRTVKSDLDAEYYGGIQTILTNAMKDISDHTGRYLHNLHKTKPDEETLAKIIQSSPKSLSFLDAYGSLPILTVAGDIESVKYVPLLAVEGVKCKVGGKEGRGGLLVVDASDDDDPMNTLQYLTDVNDTKDPVPFDTACLDAMKKLRESNLLLKEDIKDYHLLYHSCASTNILRFEYLAGLDPNALKSHHIYSEGLPLVHHTIVSEEEYESFSTFFPVALKHHPKEIGLLFQKDPDGKTVCERAMSRLKEDKLMQILGKSIPFHQEVIPILHHVAKHAPQYLDNFVKKYHPALFLRDDDGRTLQQVRLASGKITFEDNAMFIGQMTDDEISTIDPATDLYPFMVLASGETSDLSAVYHILRRNPSLALPAPGLRRGREKIGDGRSALKRKRAGK